MAEVSQAFTFSPRCYVTFDLFHHRIIFDVEGRRGSKAEASKANIAARHFCRRSRGSHYFAIDFDNIIICAPGA